MESFCKNVMIVQCSDEEEIDINKCNVCEKTFDIASNLKKHIDCVHKGSKSHKCHDCNKLFSNSRNLILHINRVHKDKKDFK